MAHLLLAGDNRAVQPAIVSSLEGTTLLVDQAAVGKCRKTVGVLDQHVYRAMVDLVGKYMAMDIEYGHCKMKGDKGATG